MFTPEKTKGPTNVTFQAQSVREKSVATDRAWAIVLHKISHTQKEKYCMLTLTCSTYNFDKAMGTEGSICIKKTTKKGEGERESNGFKY